MGGGNNKINNYELDKNNTIPAGDTRRIQIWNDNDAVWADPKGGNHYGYYMPAANKWYSLSENDKELCHVTHWAELLGEPEDLKK